MTPRPVSGLPHVCTFSLTRRQADGGAGPRWPWAVVWLHRPGGDRTGTGGGQNVGKPFSVTSKERLDAGIEATDKDGLRGT
jgi:hypothetical protein